MDFAPVYIFERFLYRLADFFRHWYVDGTKIFFGRFISFLERLDRTFAVRITIRYFFQPLYKDYSVVGRILGVIFRSCRIAVGIFVYALAAFVFLVVYFTWLAVPAIVILYVFGAR